MTDDNRLDDLLDEWEERRDEGEPVSVEQLCSDCPELIPQLQKRVEALEAMDQRLDTRAATDSSVPTPSILPSDGEDANGETLTCSTNLQELTFHARGGLGSVYVAKDRKLHREVALKFIHRRLTKDPEARTRFLVEAEVTGRLDHPGVIPVHGWGQDKDGRLFYAMRFVRGETLETAIQRYHQIADADKAAMALHHLLTSFASVCKTIAYAHNCGIIHRDIKPENIMKGRYGETLVVDWGLAMPVGRNEHARSSGEHTLMPSGGSQSGHSSATGAGTPAYMSPEQHAEAEIIGPESDIYSLGVTLYRILCGQNPFDGKYHHELRQKIIRGEYTTPRAMKPDVSRALDAICVKAMALDPRDRYATALDLSEDIEHFLADEPVNAFQEPVSYKLTRWARRHRMGAVSVVGGLAGLVVVAAMAAIYEGAVANRERELRDEAVELRKQADLARQGADAAREDAVKAQTATLRVSADYAAPLIGSEIDRRWRVLEQETSSHELRNWMLHLHKTPGDRERWKTLQDWLDACADRHNVSTNASAWTIFHRDGLLVALSPQDGEAAKAVGKNWLHRNYFHTGRMDFPSREDAVTAIDSGEVQVIQQVNLSSPFMSHGEGRLKVGFSAPIWSDDADTSDRKVLGILMCSVEIGHFNVLQHGIMVDINENNLSGKLRQGLILQHPDLQQLNRDHADRDLVVRHLDAQLVKRLESKRRETRRYLESGHRDRIKSSLLPDFNDPLRPEALSQATCMPVTVVGRNQDLADTGWVVIVPDQSSGD